MPRATSEDSGLRVPETSKEAWAPEPFHTGAWWVWLLLAIGAVAVFSVFHLRIFTPYAGKRTNRIASIEADKSPLWHFLDKKGYIIMAFMIALGASLRLSGLVPDWFIAFFYVGLGAALTACGINMVRGYRRIAA